MTFLLPPGIKGLRGLFISWSEITNYGETMYHFDNVDAVSALNIWRPKKLKEKKKQKPAQI